MLAIIWALQEWQHFVEGAEHQFEIWTDHKNLEYFMLAKQLNQRQAQWSLYLAQFDFLLHHKPGKSISKPDALLWWADHGTGKGDNSNITLLTSKFFAVWALEGVQTARPEVDILCDICKGSWELDEEPVANAVKELCKSSTWSVCLQEWSTQDGFLYFQGHIYVPLTSDLQHQIVSLCHDTWHAGHAGWFKTLELVSQNYW